MISLYDPSPDQVQLWAGWYDQNQQPDESGKWLGWCPLHTPLSDRSPDKVNATYNFSKSHFSCLAELGCHDKKGISLDRLKDMIAVRYLRAGD